MVYNAFHCNKTERKLNVSLEKVQNYQNKSRLHEYRSTILQMLDEQKTLKQIAEKIELLSGKKTSIQIIHYYVKKYPKQAENLTTNEVKSAVIVTKPTTEKEIEPLSVTKHAADDIFSSVEENRAESQADFITPNEQVKQPENTGEVKSRNPIKRLQGKIGKDKPDSDLENSKFI